MTRSTLAACALLLGLAGCVENSALGNDREAELDPPEQAAERASAESLAAIATGLLKPETFTPADLAALSGAWCRFRYTDVGFPVFLFPATGNAPAMIKLNGKMIPLPPVGDFQYAGGPVRVDLRLSDGLPAAEAEEAVLVLWLAGASGEMGFLGEAECP